MRRGGLGARTGVVARGGRRTRRGERGAATLLTVTCIGLLLLLGAALSVASAMVVAHRQAQAAADLAALAAASAVASGGDPCGEGAAVAEANGARLVACTLDGSDAVVEVVAPGPRWLGQQADLTGRARAGPAVW
ncbi:MAG TPA: Rv3654c family TadE-like protein [Nocardioides sp.]|nr:Rv3654c family TadE-like protein [Nocardioides sp.]